jgi:hypothetical protein
MLILIALIGLGIPSVVYTPSGSVLEVISDSDTVTKAQFDFFFIKIIIGKIYIYIYIYIYSYESNFQDKSIYMIHIFKLNNLKVIHDLYSQCLT